MDSTNNENGNMHKWDFDAHLALIACFVPWCKWLYSLNWLFLVWNKDLLQSMTVFLGLPNPHIVLTMVSKEILSSS